MQVNLTRCTGLKRSVTLAAHFSSAPSTSARPSSLATQLTHKSLPYGHGARAAAQKAFRPFTSRNVATVRADASGNGNGNGAGKDREYDYDLFTIGAGSGGVRASRFATQYGAKVAVCELPFDFVSSDAVGGIGGTCVLRGCVPKKLMVYASEFAEEFRESVGFGWEDRPLPAHNWTKFLEAKRSELRRLNNAYKNTLKNANVEIIEGFGKVVDPHTIDVDGKRYTAKHILIAVGGKPKKIDIPGAEYCITSDEALELPHRPNKITIIGAGYIAMEFAGIFKRLGADVHIAYRQEYPLRGFDDEVRKFITEQYLATGLNMHKGWSPTEVRKQEDGRFTAVLKHSDGKVQEIADNDYVFMATGRVPKVKNLGLEEVGVKIGKRGAIEVNEYSATSVPSIHAVGDVTDRVNLTPVALMEGMALAKTLFLDTPTKPDYNAIASAVFSHPHMATVGLTEAQAIEQFGDVDIYTSSFRPMRATIGGSPLRAFMKLVVDATTDKVVGCHMVGDDSPEIMQGFAVAVKMGVTKSQLDTVIGIHPSSAEEFVTMRTATRKVRQEAHQKVPTAA